MKAAQYFSHDSNARNDEKIIALRMKLGWEGFGLYWAIVEMLRESTDYRLSVNFNLLAFELRTSNETVKSIVTGFGLFTIEEDQFYSQSLCNRMLLKEEVSDKNRENALKRWGKKAPEKRAQSETDANAMRTHSNGKADALPAQCNKRKESKGKEKKEDARAKDSNPFPSQPKPDDIPDPDDLIIQAAFESQHRIGNTEISKKQISDYFRTWKAIEYNGAKFSPGLADIYKHFAFHCNKSRINIGPPKPPVPQPQQQYKNL
jgi:hypothetical protein